MARMKKLRKYFIIFFIFAQDVNIPLTQIPFRSLVYLPSILLLLVQLLFFWITFMYQAPTKWGLGNGESHLQLILTIFYATSSVCVLCENLLKPNAIPRIFKEIAITVRYLENKMKIPFGFEQFKRSYHRKMVAIYFTFMLSFGIRFLIKSSAHSQIIDISYFFISLFRCSAVLHILFYMIWLKCLLNSINLHFMALAHERNAFHANTLTIYFLDLKYVHFKLRKIVSILNYRFGWVINGLNLDAFIYLTNNLYWLFLYHIKFPDNGMLLLRNDIFCFGRIFLLNVSTNFIFSTSGPICNFLSCITSTVILVDACHFCSAQVSECQVFHREISKRSFKKKFQKEVSKRNFQ